MPICPAMSNRRKAFLFTLQNNSVMSSEEGDAELDAIACLGALANANARYSS